MNRKRKRTASDQKSTSGSITKYFRPSVGIRQDTEKEALSRFLPAVLVSLVRQYSQVTPQGIRMEMSSDDVELVIPNDPRRCELWILLVYTHHTLQIVKTDPFWDHELPGPLLPMVGSLRLAELPLNHPLQDAFFFRGGVSELSRITPGKTVCRMFDPRVPYQRCPLPTSWYKYSHGFRPGVHSCSRDGRYLLGVSNTKDSFTVLERCQRGDSPSAEHDTLKLLGVFRSDNFPVVSQEDIIRTQTVAFVPEKNKGVVILIMESGAWMTWFFPSQPNRLKWIQLQPTTLDGSVFPVPGYTYSVALSFLHDVIFILEQRHLFQSGFFFKKGDAHVYRLPLPDPSVFPSV